MVVHKVTKEALKVVEEVKEEEVLKVLKDIKVLLLQE